MLFLGVSHAYLSWQSVSKTAPSDLRLIYSYHCCTRVGVCDQQNMVDAGSNPERHCCSSVCVPFSDHAFWRGQLPYCKQPHRQTHVIRNRGLWLSHEPVWNQILRPQSTLQMTRGLTYLDCNLMKRPEPEPLSKTLLRFLNTRHCVS